MCVFVNPIDQVSGTIEFWHLLPTGEHLTGYQNNLGTAGDDGGSLPQLSSGEIPGIHQLPAGLRRTRGADLDIQRPEPMFPVPMGSDGANMMVLPAPAQPGTMGPRSFIKTDQTPNIMMDMVTALYAGGVETRGAKGVVTMGSGLQVINYGLWTLIVGHKVTKEALTEALVHVPPKRRPKITDQVMEVLLSFPRFYAGWTLIYAFFNIHEVAKKAGGKMPPFLYKYWPMFPDQAFIPAIDAHKGVPPVPGEPVDLDHIIMFGVPDHVKGAKVKYQDNIKVLPVDLPKKIIGFVAKEEDFNGDWNGVSKRVLGGGSVMISRTNSNRQYEALAIAA